MSQVIVRRALSEDASGISALYEEAYQPDEGGEASEHYPFPQLLKPPWVAQAIYDDWIFWVVAEHDGCIVGSAAAVRDIGMGEDRVAELFGIVVDEKERGSGVAKRLLKQLCEGLADKPQFILCESRTALTAGWKVARGCGFSPLGFEPFAHHTPVGSEAMLLTGRISSCAMAARVPHALYSPVQALAEVVLASQMPVVEDIPGKYILKAKTWSELALCCQSLSGNSLITVSREDSCGKKLIEASGDNNRQRSGVIAFRRFEGTAAQRYDRQYYVLRAGQHAMATLYVVFDRIDQRARILDLRTDFEGLQGVLLAAVLARLIEQAINTRLTVVIDVCADAMLLQEALFVLGFRPSIYYPSFIARGDTRVDGVQYTFLHNSHFEDSLDKLQELDWPSALNVIKEIKKSFQNNYAGRRTP